MGKDFEDPILLKNKIESLLNITKNYLQDMTERRAHLEVGTLCGVQCAVCGAVCGLAQRGDPVKIQFY